jgi:hypothetical protein
MSSTLKESSRVAALNAASAVIDGRLGVIEGCRILYGLSHDLVPDWRIDKDLVTFGAVYSETDALPIGSARQHWNEAALEREDEKTAHAENLFREEVVAACRRVVERFRDAQF